MPDIFHLALLWKTEKGECERANAKCVRECECACVWVGVIASVRAGLAISEKGSCFRVCEKGQRHTDWSDLIIPSLSRHLNFLFYSLSLSLSLSYQQLRQRHGRGLFQFSELFPPQDASLDWSQATDVSSVRRSWTVVAFCRNRKRVDKITKGLLFWVQP